MIITLNGTVHNKIIVGGYENYSKWKMKLCAVRYECVLYKLIVYLSEDR